MSLIAPSNPLFIPSLSVPLLFHTSAPHPSLAISTHYIYYHHNPSITLQFYHAEDALNTISAADAHIPVSHLAPDGGGCHGHGWPTCLHVFCVDCQAARLLYSLICIVKESHSIAFSWVLGDLSCIFVSLFYFC